MRKEPSSPGAGATAVSGSKQAAGPPGPWGQAQAPASVPAQRGTPGWQGVLSSDSGMQQGDPPAGGVAEHRMGYFCHFVCFSQSGAVGSELDTLSHFPKDKNKTRIEFVN